MQFALSEDQQALCDSAQRYLDRAYAPVRRQRMAVPGSFSHDTWRDFAGMGWLSLPFPEDLGGLGGSAVDAAILMELFGQHLVQEPYLWSIVICGSLVARHQRPQLLEALMDGNLQLALVPRQGSGMDFGPVFVANGAAANKFLVLAGEPPELYLIDSHAPGVSVQPVSAFDGSGGAMVTIRGAGGTNRDVLCAGDSALRTVQSALDAGAVAACAEMVGIQRALVATSAEHLKTRKQFGTELAQFQALRHRLADMVVELELAASLTQFAARCLAVESASSQATTVVSAAKLRVAQAARRTAKSAVQLHGAMGVSEEHTVAHCFTRIAALSKVCGDSVHHLGRLAEWAAETPVSPPLLRASEPRERRNSYPPPP